MITTEEKAILELEPKALWEVFVDFCHAVPRISGNEKGGVRFIEKFGKKLGLKTTVDNIGNVVIIKPATPGMENSKTVILQAHIDMVTEKVKRSRHDFAKDPLKTYIDGEWVTAHGTTLGADNGIAIAAMLAILQVKDIKHGPLVAVFTADEERGLTGVKTLTADLFPDDAILLNLDCEEIDKVYIGSAGGGTSKASIPLTKEKTPVGHVGYELVVTGLRGGHSGIDISLGRGNANKIIIEILWELLAKGVDFSLAEIHGGTRENAIARDAHAIIALNEADVKTVVTLVNKCNHTLRQRFARIEPDLSIELEEREAPKHVFRRDIQLKALTAIHNCPHGVVEWNQEIPGLVETSNNLGVVKTEADKVEFVGMFRSFNEHSIKLVTNLIAAAYKFVDIEPEFHIGVKAWEPKPDSAILRLFLQIYERVCGEKTEAIAIHAGLECGFLASMKPELNIISFGPTIKHAHSPDEKVDIASVNKFWDILVELLASIT